MKSQFIIIYILITIPLAMFAQNKIIGYQYAFNNGEGITYVPVSPTTDFHLITDIDVSQLPELVNTLHIRFKDDTGQWSSIVSKMFLKQIESGQTQDRKIAGYEYYFNDDTTHRHFTAVNPQDDFHLITDININQLPELVNTLHIRFKDNTGQWSPVISKMFLKQIESGQTQDRKITGYEYYFNDDTIHRHFTAVNPQDDFHLITDIDVSQLPNSLNVLHIRFKDDAGKWSSMINHFFMRPPITDILQGNQLVQYEYWFDDDRTHLKTIDIQPAQTDINVVELDVRHIWNGQHVLHTRYKDAYNKYSSITTDTITKTIYPYASFSVNQMAVCEGATVQFTNNSVDYDTALWDFGDGNTSTDINPTHIYQQGGTYTVTLQITENTTSQTVQLQQDISVYDYPVNTVTSSSVFPACHGSAVTLTADAQNADYLWSTGETTQSIQVSVAGAYSVEVRNPQYLDCSVTSADIQVSFLPQFDNTITVTGNNPACYGDTLTLTANEQNNVTYLWSTSETTQSIDITQAGNYSVTLTSTLNNSCSITSADVQIDFYPQIDNSISFDSNTETLHAIQGNATYQWLDCNNNYAIIQGEIYQDFSPFVSGNYAVDITMNNCMVRSDCMNITLSGVTENSLNNQIKIYPNPIDDYLIIKTKTSFQLEIYNLVGQVIKTENINNETKKLNIKQLKSGIYLFKFNSLSEYSSIKTISYQIIKK